MAVTEARAAQALPARPRGVTALSLANLEVRAGIRGPAFRFLSILALIIGFSVGGAPGRGVALSAWAVGEAAWRYLGFVVIVWMSLVAVHETVTRTDLLVYSKPQPTERLVLSKFLSAISQLFVVLLVMYAGGVIARGVSGSGLGGFSIYFTRFAVSAGVLFFTASASFSLALLARTPLAGAVAGLYWLMTLAGKGFLAKAYFPAYTQNQLTYVLLGVAFICAACALHRRQRRGATPPAAWARWLGPIALAASIAALLHVINTGHDPQAATQPALELMSEQAAIPDMKAPGFRLPDPSGKLVSPADFPDKILVIALCSPSESESTFVLERLDEIQKKYGPRGVQALALVLSEDTGAAAAFARGEGVSYPVLQDWGTHNAEKVSEMSPMATAFQINMLPHAVVTDRRRIQRKFLFGIDTYEGTELENAIEERLKAEPE